MNFLRYAQLTFLNIFEAKTKLHFGIIYQSLDRLDRALEAYSKGHCYKKAVVYKRVHLIGTVDMEDIFNRHC